MRLIWTMHGWEKCIHLGAGNSARKEKIVRPRCIGECDGMRVYWIHTVLESVQCCSFENCKQLFGSCKYGNLVTR
jgi:hypothetical protein